MEEYRKSYNAGVEKIKRFEIFKDNFKYIEQHNSLSNQTYKLGLNKFSDLTLDEFKSIYLSSSPIDSLLDESEIDFSYLPEVNSSLSLPDSVDWRKQGAVLPIKEQGSCGKLLSIYKAKIYQTDFYFFLLYGMEWNEMKGVVGRSQQ